jgi:hypothetical protein
MKNRIYQLIFVLFLISTFSTYSADNKHQKSFADLLSESKMVFQMPNGLVETSPIDNTQMIYEFAIKYPDKKFEIRYSIRPLGVMIDQYKENEKNKKPGDIFVNPNKFYSTLFQAIAMNISCGRFGDSKVFDKNSVQDEFNADWGATTFVEAAKSFGQDYKYCMMIAIHKDDCADAYIFFMTDDKDHLMELAMPAFYSLKFKTGR